MTASRRVSAPQGTQGTPAHQLATAAYAWQGLPHDRQSGQRVGDPLTALVTDDNAREWHAIAEQVTGRTIERDTMGNLAARIRATLRRWSIASEPRTGTAKGVQA